MEWIECTLSCGNDTDSVCDKLAALGVGGMSVENEEDFKATLELIKKVRYCGEPL